VEDIVIRVGSGSAAEIVTPKFRESVQELAAALRETGHSVAIEEPERKQIPGLGFLTLAEAIGIFIGTGVATALLNVVVTDIYNSAKSWARQQFKKQQSSNPNQGQLRSFTIYDSEGKPLLSWKLDGDGEHEEDHRKIDPESRR
jgi:hypothetical protein